MSQRKTDPCIMVIFGATGDLTRRKLVPALYNLQRDGLLPERFAVCAYARKAKDDAGFRADLDAELSKFSRQTPGPDWNSLSERIFYVSGELDDEAGFARLKQRLAELDAQLGTGGNRLFYLAVGSEFFVPIVEKLAVSGLISGQRVEQPWTRIVVEKPIGRDLISAREMLSGIARHAREDQIYRIDHYLGKETVQNILAMRFGNCIFEPLWNRKYVDHVQITVAEQEGVGTRGGYYDTAGALRDMVQNHLLQLLCLVAMEAPGTLRPNDIRNEKVKVLHNLRQMTPSQVLANTVRGQYGPSADGSLPPYRQEAGVARNSQTETFVALRCHVDTWRWADVPFILRTGKHLPCRETDISIHFRVPPLQLFAQDGERPSCNGNVLTINIQPDEGICLTMAAKVPGAGMRLKNVDLDFTYEESFKQQTPESYERLLLDAMNGDATLFTRADEVEAQWQFINSIQEGWAQNPAPRYPNYFAGAWGPDDAARLLPSCAAGWHMQDRNAVP
jgi:glucose-6-phosphate 1-dehydrogenase